MKRKFFNMLLFFMLSFITSIYGQKLIVSGEITSKSDGLPLPGVNVLVSGTILGTITDIDGKYTIEVNSPGAELQFSYIGYVTRIISVGNKTIIDLQLDEEKHELDEVIVIGYGVQKKSDLTGSIASVSVEDIQKLPNTGVSSMLQGMTAGVMVLQNSGQPGSEPAIRVRGLATVNGGRPLVVIDGISGGSLSDVNPSDIESIEVLKDAASQSIYGPAGGNGVILITTKKGVEGKIKVKLDAYTGVQTPWKKEFDVANSQEFAEIYNIYQESIVGVDPYFPVDGSGTYLDPTTNEKLLNTDWVDEVFRTGFIQNYNLSLSGGTKTAKVFMSTNYNSQEGTMQKTSNDKFTFRLNSDVKIFKRITVGENFSVSNNVQKSQGERNEYGSPASTSLQMYPFVPIYATDGSGNYAYKGAGLLANIKNPMASIEYNNNVANSQALDGNAFMRIDIIKGLTFESRFGMSYSQYGYRQFSPIHTIGNVDDASPSLSLPINQCSYNDRYENSWQWQNFFNYNFSLSELHNFGLTAGYESGKYVDEFSNRFQSFTDDSLPFNKNKWDEYAKFDKLNLLQPIKTKPTTNYAYFFRLNYDYKSIFLFQGNFRRDYSSKFGPNSRVGNFSSASIGIKFSEFSLVKSLNIIDFGKIRIGYGETGNSDIQPFQYLGLVGELQMSNYPFGDVDNVGVSLITAGNPDLKWETVVTQNVGLDLRFLKNRLGFTLDIFKRMNEDMLLRKSIPLYGGLYVSDAGQELGDASIETRPLANYGTLNNKGFELSLSFKNQAGELNYEVNANITRAITTIDDIGDPLYEGSGRGLANVCRTQNGGPVSAFYGYKIDGVIQAEDFTWYKTESGIWKRVLVDANGTDIVEGFDANGNPVQYTILTTTVLPGDFKYVDSDGDGSLSTFDMVQIGDPNPDFTYGLGANFEYSNFDLNLFFQGSYGNDIFNMLKVNFYTISNGGLNISNDLINGYIPPLYNEGTDNTAPAALTEPRNMNTGVPRLDGNMASSEFFVEDGSYLRLKNLQLGYTIPPTSLEKLKIQKLRVYIGAKNLLTFTKYTGNDPEVNETSILERGFDRGTYPQSKMFLVGLNINF